MIPAYREEASIGLVVTGAARHVGRVLVVDDGSPDGTAEAARAAGADLLRRAANEGKGAAVRSGLAWAAARGFEWVLLMDADGQHDPADIPRLLAAAQARDADLVIGRRPLNGDTTSVRRVTNRLGTRILCRWTGLPLEDSQSGFRLVRLSALDGLGLRSRRFEIETEMLLKMARAGARVAEVATRPGTPPPRASHLRPVRDVTRICLHALWLRYAPGRMSS